MSRQSRESPRNEQGFILVAVIVVIALIGLALAFFTEWVGQATDRAIKLRDRVEAERQIVETLADTLYWIGTQPLGPRGIELMSVGQKIDPGRPLDQAALSQLLGGGPGPRAERFLRVDGTDYASSNGTLVRLLDTRGLLNINFTEPDDLGRMLSVYDIPLERRGGLINKLLDYVDTDDLVRFNGAEKLEYAAAGRPPPMNNLMRTPYESRAVLDWDLYPQFWTTGGVPSITSASRTVGINLNSVPRGVLAALGVTPELADALLEFRAKRPFETVAEAGALLGAQAGIDPFRFLVNPSNTFRIFIRDSRNRMIREFQVALTPQSTRGPWRIDYVLGLSSSVFDAGDQQVSSEPFPEPAALLPPP